MECNHRYMRLIPIGKKLVRYRVVCACCGLNRNWLPDAEEEDRLCLILPDDDEAKVTVLLGAEVYPDGETLKAVRRICP